MPRSSWGTMIAHAGVGVMVLGLTGASAWRVERIEVMKPGQTMEVAGVVLTFKGARPDRGPNYEEVRGSFDVHEDGKLVTTLETARRVYVQPKMPTTETGIYPFWSGDLYIALGDPNEKNPGAFTVRVFFNPLVNLIWIGALIMFLGGAVSLTDRRYRVGAPRRARRRMIKTAGQNA
ncbi:MAG TPA: hypothetical protein ENK41_05800 [Rhodobacteraceae bacterium]|nr:hypothetical protein [Paracoccaceae bacterium]